MAIGDLFIQRDSRGFYLRQIIDEEITASRLSLKIKDFWRAKNIFSFGEHVKNGQGTYKEGDCQLFAKEEMDYWIWL